MSNTTIITAPEKPITSLGIKRHYTLAGDVVRKAIVDLDEHPKELIWWLHTYCQEKNLDRQQLGSLIKKGSGGYYSSDSVLQLLKGDRIRKGETIDAILEAIRPLYELDKIRKEQATSGFIRTRLYKEYERRCDRARARQRIFFGFGDSQIGKTENAKEYLRTHNHGQTVYVDMPTGGSLGKFVNKLAEAIGITGKNFKMEDLQSRIVNSFDPSMLLIIDNAHRCFSGRFTRGGLATFSWIQEIYDTARCGMNINMTNEGRNELTSGQFKTQLLQIWRRRIDPLQYPNITPEDDLALFAAAYGLEPATDHEIEIQAKEYTSSGNLKTVKHKQSPLALQRSVNATEGLGVWINILQNASDIAHEMNRKITWGAVIKAHCQSQLDAQIFA